ncbi:MAG: tRNA (N6-threonylcarbamoyladenosine(37)-N6)-methyltransferase TrmO [Marinibacterium sp.]|nr:tRNA (N6-threonylcarbamoyladenosine(37)-N6)-methyltransferase TrmO [Marinibacterium sp.]
MTGIRPGELAGPAPDATDAGLQFIGRIRTPWTERADCPRQGRSDGPVCRVVVFAPWVQALDGIERFADLDLIYWLHQARRDLLVQTPRHADGPRGTFALRSPVRPNPLGLSRVQLVRREDAVLHVRGLDCLDGTPLIDIKPNRCAHSA